MGTRNPLKKCDFCQKLRFSFDKFVIFETLMTSHFSLQFQRKIPILVNLSLILY
nr:MAG TPA: tax1-binding protein [Caudoviricetes sp.]